MLMNKIKRNEEKKKEMIEFDRVCDDMKIMGFYDEEIKVIWYVLYEIYNLGIDGDVKDGKRRNRRWKL
jgi:hypothetical protein